MEVVRPSWHWLRHSINLGFVIDVSILESSQADVYAIIRIDKLMVLKHLQEK